MTVREWAEYLDGLLDIFKIPDESCNGLQVEGEREIWKVAFAVDLSLEAVAAASSDGMDALFVHHGLIWGGLRNVRGVRRLLLKGLLGSGMSLYAAHLPLDAHPTLGNNAVIAGRLGLDRARPFGLARGFPSGIVGDCPGGATRDELVARVAELVGPKPSLFPFGGELVRRVAVVSGGGASLAEAAAEEGADFFLTGETSHSHFHAMRALGVNVCFAGHYHTEKWGPLAVMDHLAGARLAECRFYDFPTPF